MSPPLRVARPQRRAVLVAMLVVACERPPSAADAGTVPDAPPLAPPPPECRPAPAGEAVAQWIAPDRCPWVASKIGDVVRLESLSLSPPPVVEGPAPQCRIAACRYEGVDTELGPMLVVTEPGAESDVPTAVFVGVVAGGRIAFVDLWAGGGEHVREDETIVGPAFALEPQRCSGGVGFVAAARVPGTVGGPPPSLTARQGLLRTDRAPTMAAATPGDAIEIVLESGAPSGCAPLRLPLP